MYAQIKSEQANLVISVGEPYLQENILLLQDLSPVPPPHPTPPKKPPNKKTNTPQP